MSIVIGLIVAFGSMITGFTALGGGVLILWQPWEFLIIFGISTGAFIMSNPMKTVSDTMRGIYEALSGNAPSRRDYFDVLGLLYHLMRELRSHGRSEVEPHIENPEESRIFERFPYVLNNRPLCNFICDYFRLLLVGNARSHEIEALMDEEIQTMNTEHLKPYHALQIQSEALPAIGIVAAVLGVIKALSAVDQPPQVLGSLIGAALVGTFVGIFASYAIVGPLAYKVKAVREKQSMVYQIVKQSMLAFMNGAAPQIALEYGRKMISDADRPTIDEVEEEMAASAETGGAAQQQRAAG